MYSIYGIKKDNESPIYYIGMTKDIKQRKRQHKYLGRVGVFEVLATCDSKEDAIVIERHYLAKYRDSIDNKKECYYTGVTVKELITST